MFRLLFVMLFTVIIGVGSGYFLWGTRVARLTESLSGLTLELDTMRARLATPQAGPSGDVSTRTADELHVINEAITAFRQELADQKAMIEKQAAAAVPPDVATVSNELRSVRNELAACIADKADLQLRSSGIAPPPPPPSPQPSYQQAPPVQAPAQPSYTPPAQRYRPPGAPPAGSPGLDDPRY